MSDDRIQRVTMPKWGLSMKTGKIVEWFVAEGDTIDKGDDIVDIETDKIAGTLEAPAAACSGGIIAEGATNSPVGAVLVVVARATVPKPAEIDTSSRRRRRRRAGGRWRCRTSHSRSIVEIGGRTISYFTLSAEEPGGRSSRARARLRRRQELVAVRAAAARRAPRGARARPARARCIGQGGGKRGSLAYPGRYHHQSLDALGISRAHLVGHSLGGGEAETDRREDCLSRSDRQMKNGPPSGGPFLFICSRAQLSQRILHHAPRNRTREPMEMPSRLSVGASCLPHHPSHRQACELSML